MKHPIAIFLLAGICLGGCASAPPAQPGAAAAAPADPPARPVYVIQFFNSADLWTNYSGPMREKRDAEFTVAISPLLAGKQTRILETTNP